jgi:hypothetical protein
MRTFHRNKADRPPQRRTGEAIRQPPIARPFLPGNSRLHGAGLQRPASIRGVAPLLHPELRKPL